MSLADRIRRELLRRHGGVQSPIFGGKVSGAVRADNHRHRVIPVGAETIERVLLWAPGGFGPGEVEVLRRLSSIPARGRQPALQLLPWALLERPDHQVLGEARSWRSATPYLPLRHSKTNGRDTVPQQIQRECHQRGLPEPQVTCSPAPDGCITHRHGQPKPAGPPQMVQLQFPDPVSGPLLLGANSHFGMGRFVPSEEGSDQLSQTPLDAADLLFRLAPNATGPIEATTRTWTTQASAASLFVLGLFESPRCRGNKPTGNRPRERRPSGIVMREGVWCNIPNNGSAFASTA